MPLPLTGNNKPSGAAWSSSLVVAELDSDGTVLRSLTLIGPAMPKWGASWPTKWYPGNPDEATQLVLVDRELPSQWEGEWNLTRMNRRPSRYVEQGGKIDVTAPGFLVDTLDDMRRKGRRLRVTWVTDSANPQLARTVLREGRIKRFEPKYRTSVDVEWSIEFHWMSRGSRVKRVASTRDASMQGATSAVSASMAATQAAVQNMIAANNFPTTFSLGQLEQLADAPLQLLGSIDAQIESGLFTLQQLGSVVTAFKNLPYNLAAQAVGVAADVMAALNLFGDQMTGQPAEAQVLSDEVDDLTRTQVGVGAAIDQAYLAARDAQTSQASLRSLLSTRASAGGSTPAQAGSATRPGAILAIYVTRTGDTPQSISMAFYKSPDHDIDILRANDLPWYQANFAPGSILVIPTLKPGQSP
jgi:hypothetical protein